MTSMKGYTIEITKAEWFVLECLWKESPKTVMQIVKEMKEQAGWAKSTTTTMVKRMTEKGLLRCEEGEKARLYYPMVDQEEAVHRETESFLDRVYQGSIGMMMSAMVKRNNLTEKDIEELHALLDAAEKKGGC